MPKGSSGKQSPAQRIAAKEASISRNDYETGVLFDDKGNVVFEKKGQATSVSFTSTEIAQMKDKVFTHNHPYDDQSVKLGFEAVSVFSPADLATAYKAEVKELRMVVGNSKYSFEWTRRSSLSAGLLMNDVDKMTVSLNKSLDRITTNYRNGKYSSYEEYIEKFYTVHNREVAKINNYLADTTNQTHLGYRFKKG